MCSIIKDSIISPYIIVTHRFVTLVLLKSIALVLEEKNLQNAEALLELHDLVRLEEITCGRSFGAYGFW